MAHSPQVRIAEDFEDNLLTNWTNVTGKLIAVVDGVAQRSAGTPAIAWQSENPPQSTEQHIQANVVVTTFGAGQYISLLARLDSDVTAASYSPKDGYQMRLIFTTATLFSIGITKARVVKRTLWLLSMFLQVC